MGDAVKIAITAPKIWEQNIAEDAGAFAAFCFYRDMPPITRSIDAAFKSFADQWKTEHPGIRRPRGQHLKAWRKYARNNMWVSRAKQYDKYRDDLRRQAVERVDVKLATHSQRIAGRITRYVIDYVEKLINAANTTNAESIIDDLTNKRGSYSQLEFITEVVPKLLAVIKQCEGLLVEGDERGNGAGAGGDLTQNIKFIKQQMELNFYGGEVSKSLEQITTNVDVSESR